MPGDLATAWLLYLMSRGHRRRAAALVRLLAEAHAALQRPEAAPGSPARSPRDRLKRQAAVLELRKRQMQSLARLLVRLQAQEQELAKLGRELKTLAGSGSPLLAEPEIGGTLARVEAELPAALAGTRRLADKLRARLAELEAACRADRSTLDLMRLARR